MTISTTSPPSSGGVGGPLTSVAVTDALGFVPGSAAAVAGKLDSAHAGSGGTAHADAVAGGAAGFISGADKSKLDGIASGATANSTDAVLIARANHTGSQPTSTVTGLDTALAGKLDTSHAGSGGAAHANVVAGGAAGFMTGADKTKLDGVATGATANATDAQLRDRATHTGTQAAGTITGLATVATSGSASDLGSGTLPAARLPTAPDITDPKLLGTIYTRQPAQTTKAAAATLTIAELLTRIIQYTGAAASLTMPTGTLIDAGILAGLPVDRAFEFTVVNTGTGIATITTATGLTLLGAMAVTNGTSGTFRVRKTAAATFTVIRI